MTERLAVDTNALVHWFRAGKPEHSQLTHAQRILVPLPVVGELYAGAFASQMRETNLRIIDEFVARYEVLKPDEATARIYGRLRARFQQIGQSKKNDVWIAALCVQHELPLLTDDHGFDTFPELRVVDW